MAKEKYVVLQGLKCGGKNRALNDKVSSADIGSAKEVRRLLDAGVIAPEGAAPEQQPSPEELRKAEIEKVKKMGFDELKDYAEKERNFTVEGDVKEKDLRKAVIDDITNES